MVQADLAKLLDDSRWGARQKMVLALSALAVVFDGLDNQLIGFAAPALIADWKLSRADLVPIIASSLVAMTLGTMIAGLVADRIGRRATLIASVAIFGVASAMTALAPNLEVMLSLRLAAALGLGGAMPTATALIAEFTPVRHRGFAITLGIVCVPLGGLLGGVLSAVILPALGWRGLFAIGGGMPIASAVILAVYLPESPQLLIAFGRGDQARAVLRLCGIQVADGNLLLVADRTRLKPWSRSSVDALFVPGRARDTLLLWLAFSTCLFAVYSVFNWAPTFLSERGLGLRVASSGLAAFNMGGVGGALACGRMIDRYGSRRPLAGMAILAVAASLILAVRPPFRTTSLVELVAMFAILGWVVNGVQTSLFAVAAARYPPVVRATGVGMALGIGRFGAVLSSVVGAAMLSLGGAGYFGSIAIAMTAFLAAMLMFREHILPVRQLVWNRRYLSSWNSLFRSRKKAFRQRDSVHDSQ